MIAASTKLSALFAAKHDGQPSATHPYDVTLILIALALMSIGIIIVTSISFFYNGLKRVLISIPEIRS